MLSQVSIFAENKKGRLQNITSLLQKENINIWGSITNDSAEYGIIRMVVSNPEHAEKVLAEAGYLCRLTEVLGVELDDEVGALNRLLISLEESNINVDYLYLSFNRDSGKPVMVLHRRDIRYCKYFQHFPLKNRYKKQYNDGEAVEDMASPFCVYRRERRGEHEKIWRERHSSVGCLQPVRKEAGGERWHSARRSGAF